MTLNEAFQKGIARVRLVNWSNPNCCLKQDIIEINGEKRCGPWLSLFDKVLNEAVGDSNPQRRMRGDYLSDGTTDYADYAAYTGPLDPDDK